MHMPCSFDDMSVEDIRNTSSNSLGHDEAVLGELISHATINMEPSSKLSHYGHIWGTVRYLTNPKLWEGEECCSYSH